MIGFIAWTWRHGRERGGQVIASAQEKAQAQRQESAVRERNARHSRQVRQAKHAGENVVVRVTGSNPATVTWNGVRPEETFSYSDLRRYKRDMQSRRVPHLRTTCCGHPPKVGTRRKVTT